MRIKGGQNIVQAGNNGGNMVNGVGNAAARFLQQRAGHAMRKDLITHSANERLRTNLTEALMSPAVMGNYFDYANQTHGADHPNVVNGVINPGTKNPYQASDLLRPAFAHFVNNFGIQSGKYGITPGSPSKGAEQEKARKERLEAFPQSASGSKSRTENMNDGVEEGKSGNFKDTQAAYKSGYITSEEAAATNPKFNTNYESYKSKNPSYKGSSEANINAVHNKLDSLGN
jgi:hypothetical protein